MGPVDSESPLGRQCASGHRRLAGCRLHVKVIPRAKPKANIIPEHSMVFSHRPATPAPTVKFAAVVATAPDPQATRSERTHLHRAKTVICKCMKPEPLVSWVGSAQDLHLGLDLSGGAVSADVRPRTSSTVPCWRGVSNSSLLSEPECHHVWEWASCLLQRREAPPPEALVQRGVDVVRR